MYWEFNFIIWLQSVLPQWFITINSFISMLGEELVMVAILGFIYWGVSKRIGEYVGFALLSANAANSIIKNIVKRPRPYMVNNEIVNHKPVASGDISDPLIQGYSFPSGHSQGAAALYPAIAMCGQKKWQVYIAIIVPLLVAFSRIVLGVHYPTDVIGGLFIGVCFAVGMYFLLKVVKNKYIVYVATIIICCSGLFFAKSEDYFTSLGMLIGFTAGIWFEERYVKFNNTRVWWRIILRVAAGGALFIGLSSLLKIPFNLISENHRILRIVRYAITVFTCIGIYPLLFKLIERIFKSKISQKT